MITKQYGHYLKFIAKEHNLLLISDRHFDEFNDIKEMFYLYIQRVANIDELDNINNTLMQNNINIIVIDFAKNYKIAIKIYESIMDYNENMIIIGILKEKSVQKISFLLNKLNGLLFDSFNVDDLKEKLFINLSVFSSIEKISNQKDIISSSNSNDELGEFFDLYEGQLIFIIDELIEYNNLLKAGELSEDILQNVALEIQTLAEIFSKEKKISAVVNIFEDFSKYLSSLDLSQIEPSSLHAFDYLCALIDDINSYMMDMFVDRVFRDVYIFQHSFENNLVFMKDAISLKDDDDGVLEFF